MQELGHGSNEERLYRLEKDMWFGNGKPGLTVRMALMEDCYEKLARNLSKFVWLAVGTFLSGLSAVVLLIITIVLRSR